jgi:hypothetical protein
MASCTWQATARPEMPPSAATSSMTSMPPGERAALISAPTSTRAMRPAAGRCSRPTSAPGRRSARASRNVATCRTTARRGRALRSVRWREGGDGLRRLTLPATARWWRRALPDVRHSDSARCKRVTCGRDGPARNFQRTPARSDGVGPYLLLGRADGTFREPVLYRSGVGYYGQSFAVDFDGGMLDLAMSGGILLQRACSP